VCILLELVVHVNRLMVVMCHTFFGRATHYRESYLQFIFFAYLDKASNKPSCCEVSHQKLFSLEIWMITIRRQMCQKVGFPKYCHK